MLKNPLGPNKAIEESEKRNRVMTILLAAADI